MSKFSLSSNSTRKRLYSFFRFGVDVLNGELCLHLFVTTGKEFFIGFLACSSFQILPIAISVILTFSIFSSLLQIVLSYA